MEKCHLPTMISSSSSSNDDSDLRTGGTATSSDEKIVKKPKTRKILRRSFPERPRENSTSGEGPDTLPLENSSSNHKRKVTSNKGLGEVSTTAIREHESFCRICARGGPFMKCHTCTAVYHKTCMYEVAWIRAANATWRCPNCLYMRRKDALRPDNLTIKECLQGERTEEHL